MGYYVTHIIGVRDVDDVDEFKKTVSELVKEIEDDKSFSIGIDAIDPSHCISSNEMTAGKGGYVVIAGVFNKITYEVMSDFCRKLSSRARTFVVHTCWYEERTSERIMADVWCEGDRMVHAEEDEYEHKLHPVERNRLVAESYINYVMRG